MNFWGLKLTIQEISSHQELKRDLRGDGKLRYLGRAVGITNLVGEILTDFLQDVGRYFTKVYFVRFILGELTCEKYKSIL